MPEDDQVELEMISEEEEAPLEEEISPDSEEPVSALEQPLCPVVKPHSFVVLREALGCGKEPSNNKVILMAARKIRKG